MLLAPERVFDARRDRRRSAQALRRRANRRGHRRGARAGVHAPADVIRADVLELLQGLADKGVVKAMSGSGLDDVRVTDMCDDRSSVDDEPTEGVERRPSRPPLPARARPFGLLAELTHRCPLQCPYCSNPLELERVNKELTTADVAAR